MIYARPALDTFIVVNFRRALFTHRDSLYLTCAFAWPSPVCNCTVRASPGTSPAVYTFSFVYVRNIVLIVCYGIFRAYIITPVSKTSTARISHFVTAHWAFIARYFYYLYDIGIFPIAAHRQLNALTKNRALLINTTSHSCRITWHYYLRYIYYVLKKRIVPCKARNFAQHFII